MLKVLVFVLPLGDVGRLHTLFLLLVVRVRRKVGATCGLLQCTERRASVVSNKRFQSSDFTAPVQRLDCRPSEEVICDFHVQSLFPAADLVWKPDIGEVLATLFTLSCGVIGAGSRHILFS